MRRPRLPTLFPENSKTGGDTAALPAIWANMADFKGRYEKFGAEAKAAQSTVKDLDSFKAAFRRTDQELRRLPRDLSGQEELTYSRLTNRGRPSL